MPLKMFIAGPPEAGKTTLLNSLMHYVSTDQDSKEKQKENSKGSLRNTGQSLLRNRNEHICDDHQERTIGLNVHFEKLFENNPFLVYDLGGQESYYALQAIFLDVDNAFFLVVINMLDNTDELTKHIDKQLSIISSKLPRDAKSAVVLIGTHCENELMDDEEREDKESTIMVTGNSFMDKCENLMLQEEYLFMDARKKKSEEIKVLTGICTDIAVDARKVMVCICISLILYHIY